MKTLKGFTLTDVIVTMVISLFITGIAFSIFRLTYNQLFSYQKDKDKFQDLLMLHTAISNDLRQSERVTFEPGILSVQSDYRGEMQYFIYDNFIIRKIPESSDTFRFRISDIITQHQRNNSNSNKDLVDEISMIIELDNKDYPFYFYKNYPLEMDFEKE